MEIQISQPFKSMRTFKFKIWHNEREEMYKPSDLLTLQFEEKGRWFLMNQNGDLVCNHMEGELIISTGFPDKDGREIYEGDILKTPDEISKMQTRKGQIVLDTLRVIWDQQSGFYEVRNGTFHCNLSTAAICGCEVVGNIYQNKELLT